MQIARQTAWQSFKQKKFTLSFGVHNLFGKSQLQPQSILAQYLYN